jgi:cell wall-associated NlpC family hydrolase
VFAGVVVTVLCCTPFSAARPAAAVSLAGAREQATEIIAQLRADATRLDALSQEYITAQQKVEQLDTAVARTQAAIKNTRQRVGADRTNLRNDAIAAYMSGGVDGGLQSMFSGAGEKTVVTEEYRSVATGNISGAIDMLNLAEVRLHSQQDRLRWTRTEANAALARVTASRQEAEATVAAQKAILSGVKGQIATLVAQQEAQSQAKQFAAFTKRIGDAALPNVPASGGAAAAVAAAKSQIGVPYQWGGESPGVGFDCSGLTQWAWGRAGVGLPRTAQEQYDAVVHVSLSALQPGDLVFWGSGGISHVGVYVGGGNVVHAPETGETVRVDPIWNSGLVGAGRP